MSRWSGMTAGLSPRVRGNHRMYTEYHTTVRSIPACAGEPGAVRRHAGQREVYPRVCGGTYHEIHLRYGVAGLSPRVRGTLSTRIQRAAVMGLSPRVRGTRRARAEGRVLPGLSPRVRGNQVDPVAVGVGGGSIPACAGEPSSRPRYPISGPVYPRVCGGTVRPRPSPVKLAGLSPRVRGNHARYGIVAQKRGSIPACAGEPSIQLFAAAVSEVYPRVCGGTGMEPATILGRPGLSPRVRGNRQYRTRRDDENGSIPACAGEPTPPWHPAWTPGVYPRVCGEPGH